MATRVIDDSKLQDIAVAIQGKDGGGTMTVEQMPTRIAEIPTGGGSVEKKDVNFYDWEGTLLFGYSVEEVQAMTSLPAPDTSQNYQTVDHDLLTFQEWNWSLANIKTWIQNHSNQSLGVGAIYTTTDGQDHNYWDNPRLNAAIAISMQKRGTTEDIITAFLDHCSLELINIPDGATSIGIGAFLNCYMLKQINIPNGVTIIKKSAFQNCQALKRINLPNGVTTIGDSAFNGCSSLTQINLPDSITTIGTQAFQYCQALKRINLPNGVTTIGNYTFQSCGSLTQINIPNSVTTIGDYAFQYCYVLEQINISNNVTTIGVHAFHYCHAIKQINLPNSVTTIGDSAFQDCRSLTQINLPNSVTTIGSLVFQGGSALCDILLESKPTLSNINAFNNLPSNYRLYVPRAYLSWFETGTNWATIYAQGHIVAIEDYIDYLESIGFNVDKYKEAA